MNHDVWSRDASRSEVVLQAYLVKASSRAILKCLPKTWMHLTEGLKNLGTKG